MAPNFLFYQFEIGGIALGGMEAGITQDNHPFFELPNEPLKGGIPDRESAPDGPAGAFAQEYTVMHNTLSDNKLYGHGKASQYCISDLTVL